MCIFLFHYFAIFVVFLQAYFVFTMSCLSKEECNEVHAVVSFVPVSLHVHVVLHVPGRPRYHAGSRELSKLNARCVQQLSAARQTLNGTGDV